jgi:hypothetical protein
MAPGGPSPPSRGSTGGRITPGAPIPRARLVRVSGYAVSVCRQSGLIDAITLTPEAGIVRIELKGNLAAMLGATAKSKRSPETGDLPLQVSMVAGACNPLYLEFTWTAA